MHTDVSDMPKLQRGLTTVTTSGNHSSWFPLSSCVLYQTNLLVSSPLCAQRNVGRLIAALIQIHPMNHDSYRKSDLKREEQQVFSGELSRSSMSVQGPARSGRMPEPEQSRKLVTRGLGESHRRRAQSYLQITDHTWIHRDRIKRTRCH